MLLTLTLLASVTDLRKTTTISIFIYPHKLISNILFHFNPIHPTLRTASCIVNLNNTMHKCVLALTTNKIGVQRIGTKTKHQFMRTVNQHLINNF